MRTAFTQVLRYVLGWPPKILQQVLQAMGRGEGQETNLDPAVVLLILHHLTWL